MAAAGTTIVGLVATDIYQGTRESLGLPFSIQARVADDCPGGQYVIPRGELDRLPEADAINSRWAYSVDGLDIEPLYLLSLQGDSDTSVVLHGLEVRTVTEVASPDEAVVLNTCYDGGDLFPRRFVVELAPEAASVRPESGDVEIPMDGGDPAPEFPLTISSSDPEVFWVTVESECYCEWQLALQWTSGERSGTTPIQLANGPFRTAPGIGSRDAPGDFYVLQPNGRVRPSG